MFGETVKVKAGHLLVDRSEGTIVEKFETYDAALAAWTVLGGDAAESRLAVRSGDDPWFAGLPFSKDSKRRVEAMRAAREWRRREIGATALQTIKDHPEVTFDGLTARASASLRDRGIGFERFEVTDAVKSRVILGRCRRDRWNRGCDRAFWMPKKAGRLTDQTCPSCGLRLAQSTLALGSGFASLSAAHAKAAATS